MNVRELRKMRDNTIPALWGRDGGMRLEREGVLPIVIRLPCPRLRYQRRGGQGTIRGHSLLSRLGSAHTDLGQVRSKGSRQSCTC
jgi:hypothetical protein